MRVLLVEPDPDYVAVISSLIKRRNWEIVTAVGAEEAAEQARQGSYSLAMVAATVLSADGTSAVSTLRPLLRAPIIALVDARADPEADSVLEEGANYDLAKPFTPRHLRAAMKAALSCAETSVGVTALPERLAGNGHVLTLVRHEVQVDGRRVVLSPREYALFRILAGSPGRSFQRAELVSLAWGAETGRPSVRQVDVYVGYLRRKLEPEPKRPRFIVTERGVGYCWRWDAGWESAEAANA